MEVTRHQHILVGIETDLTRYHGENAGRPALLDAALTQATAEPLPC